MARLARDAGVALLVYGVAAALDLLVGRPQLAAPPAEALARGEQLAEEARRGTR